MARIADVLPEFTTSLPARAAELWQTVLDALRLAIVSGQLRPGTPMREDALSRRFGVSRGPVRDALQQLEREGLVKSLPRRGAFVLGLTTEDVAEIYALRTLLEGHAARQAAPRIRRDAAAAAALTELDRLARRMDNEASRLTRGQLAGVDLAFHRQLVSMGGSKRVLAAWDTLAGQVGALLTVTDRTTTELPRVLANHRQIVEALRSGSADAAVAAVGGHMSHAERVMAEAMRLTSEQPGVQANEQTTGLQRAPGATDEPARRAPRGGLPFSAALTR